MPSSGKTVTILPGPGKAVVAPRTPPEFLAVCFFTLFAITYYQANGPRQIFGARNFMD